MKLWWHRLTGLVGLALTWAATGQPYGIESATLDGGGGTSRGNGFTLTATIGQSDAHTSRGGGFTFEGGFWPGATAVMITGGPTLVIEPWGELMRISWSPAKTGFVLEEASVAAGGTWAPVPGGIQSPVTVTVGPASRYFRLRKP
jgi:hypothetical protein